MQNSYKILKYVTNIMCQDSTHKLQKIKINKFMCALPKVCNVVSRIMLPLHPWGGGEREINVGFLGGNGYKTNLIANESCLLSEISGHLLWHTSYTTSLSGGRS